MESLDAEKLKTLLSVLAPGLLILWVRQWFVAGPNPPFQERVVAYAGVSTVYYAVSVPLFAVLDAQLRWPTWTSNAFEYVLLPVALGALLAVSAAQDLVGNLIRKTGASPNHHTPAAWDYAFSRLRGQTYLIVTLNDGSRVYGHYGQKSFASSSTVERDLLIEEVWDVSDKGVWTKPADSRSILLCGKDIRAIELVRTT
jgi:hypothetical protein